MIKGAGDFSEYSCGPESNAHEGCSDGIDDNDEDEIVEICYCLDDKCNGAQYKIVSTTLVVVGAATAMLYSFS